MGNDHQGSLLGLHQSGNVVQAKLDSQRLLTANNLLTGSLGLGSSAQTQLLVGLSLGLVLVQQAEQVGGSVLVQGAGELVDGRRDLQAALQDGALALEADVLGPADHAGQVALGLDIVADGEVAGALLDQGVALLGGGLALGGQRGSGDVLLGGLHDMN